MQGASFNSCSLTCCKMRSPNTMSGVPEYFLQLKKHQVSATCHLIWHKHLHFGWRSFSLFFDFYAEDHSRERNYDAPGCFAAVFWVCSGQLLRRDLPTRRDEKDTESMLGVRDLPVVHLDTCPLCIPFCSIKADHECMYIYIWPNQIDRWTHK